MIKAYQLQKVAQVSLKCRLDANNIRNVIQRIFVAWIIIAWAAKLLFKGLTPIVVGAFVLAGGLDSIASTNNLDESILRTRQDVEVAVAELNSVRAEIEVQRAPLAEKYDVLNRIVRDKRLAYERMVETRKFGEDQRLSLQAEVSHLEDECQFILAALSEYRRGLATHVSAAELQCFRPELNACDELLKNRNFAGITNATASVLRLAAYMATTGIGGFCADGSALNGAGIEVQGKFLFMGSLVYFANSNGVGGIVINSTGSLLPSYFGEHSAQEQAAIVELVAGGTAVVPLDISRGDALRVEAAGDSIVMHIRKGGFIMVPLLLIGLVAVVLSFWKFFDLRGMRIASPEPLDAVVAALGSGSVDVALEAAKSLPPSLASLVGDALEYRSSPREHLEEILHEHILSMMPKLEQHLGTLAVLGGVAPLLGLLGTVTGMIHTFDLITIFGTGEARLLSGGISEALITTKFGLGIAIPVLLVHAFFARRIRTVVAELENAAIRFVNVLKIEKS